MTIGKGTITLKKLLSSNECEFVSLGYNCDVAQLLRYSGLRKKAYPFDWCITPNRSVIKVIENDFNGFFDLNNITFSEPHKAALFEGEDGLVVESDKVVVTAYCGKYGMIFPHDLFDGDMYEGVADKYNKRIDRFLNLTKESKIVVFIFNPESESESAFFTESLRACLSLKFSMLEFYVYSLDELERAVNRSLKRSVLKFFNRKAQRINQFFSRKFN
ncbi:MAG: DUF1796 family putative cysteine peptidase [Oceanisphaera sp.]|uniref:DUF1796 family putative cysteine peptidase n=1 Tax=Oceanisphaera sp. TaxID=1929979 RepID=UPI003C7335CC